MLADSVPSTKREEIETIAARDGPVMERVQLIKDQFNQYAEEKLRGFKLKSQDRVEDFFADRIRSYQQALADAISSPRSSSSASSSGQEIAGFMPPGKDLSGTEFRYLYEGSKRVSTGDRQADSDSIMRTLADRIYDAQRSEAGSGHRARGATDGGIGMGLEGIGQLAYGTHEQALKGEYPELETIYRNMTNTRDKHLTALTNGGVSTLQQKLATLFLHVNITRESMLKLAANNILVPLNFLLFRPHMQYQMKMGIKCATGGRTGHMYYGSSNAMIQGEVSRKISKLHFTTHMRAVVEQPKNVYVQPDIYSEAYRGGNGIRFYTPETYRAKDMDQLYYSIICVAIPFAEREIPTPMDTSGRFYIEYSQGLLNAEQFEELHYSTAFRYNLLYGFFQQTKQQGGDGLVVHNVDNRQMYQGHQFMYNVKSKAFDKVRTNKGHWGPDVYAGVGQVRAGQLKHMREQDYTNYSVL
jgi:hypothetical protein